MGYWGSIILARSAEALDTVDAITSRDAGLENPEEYDGGWRAAETNGSSIANDAPQMLLQLVEQTGAPALTGYVMDSDCVDLFGYGRRSGLWRACLGRTAMADFYADHETDRFDDTFLHPNEAADRAAGWAREAGLDPDHAGLVELFARADEDLVGESEFDELRLLLGIHHPPVSPTQSQAVRTPSLERRLDQFLDAHVAPRLLAAGFTRHERGFTFENNCQDLSAIAFYPFKPGFRVHAAILYKGREFSPFPRGRIDLVMAIGQGLASWERAWETPGIGDISAIPADNERLADLAAAFDSTLAEIVSSIAGMLDRVAFIDILHGHGQGNLSRDFSQWKGPGPGLLPDLETLFESPPCFALADALMATGAATEPSPTGVDQIVKFVEQRLDGIDPVWKTESQIVRNQHSQMLDEQVSPLLRKLGYEATETGYERSSNSGDKVQLDVVLSAKSSSTRIGFYVHAGLAIPEQIDWDQHALGRFNPLLTLPRNAAED